MEQNYKVSVCCLAYNHEKYIRKALESFLSQKTDFAFKVYVHDDASTDSTAEIIKEYAQKYPDIIVPILQTENQYSQKVNIYDVFLANQIQTEYVARCEGDDYWTDENKLQLQYEYMQQHPECSMCVHNTVLVTESGEDTGRIINTAGQDMDYMAEEVIASTAGMCHTSSFFYRNVHRASFPDWMRIPTVGDYPLSMWMAMNGSIHYIDRVMSAYRLGAVGSWSKRNKKNIHKIYASIISQLSIIDEKTEYRYTEAIHCAIGEYYFRICVFCGRPIAMLRHPDSRRYFQKMPFIKKMKSVLRCVLNKAQRRNVE